MPTALVQRATMARQDSQQPHTPFQKVFIDYDLSKELISKARREGRANGPHATEHTLFQTALADTPTTICCAPWLFGQNRPSYYRNIAVLYDALNRTTLFRRPFSRRIEQCVHVASAQLFFRGVL